MCCANVHFTVKSIEFYCAWLLHPIRIKGCITKCFVHIFEPIEVSYCKKLASLANLLFCEFEFPGCRIKLYKH